MRCISSSQPWLLLRDQLEKAKLEVIHYQALYDKLQVVIGSFFLFLKKLVVLCLEGFDHRLTLFFLLEIVDGER